MLISLKSRHHSDPMAEDKNQSGYCQAKSKVCKRALTAKHISVLVVLPFLSLLFILNSSNMLGRGTAHSLIRSASAGLNCKSSLQTRGHFSSALFKHKGNPLRRCVGHSACTCKQRKLDEKGRLHAWDCSMLGGGLHSPIPHSAQCGHPLSISTQKQPRNACWEGAFSKRCRMYIFIQGNENH